MKNESSKTTETTTRKRKITQTQAQGGMPVQVRFRKMDLLCLGHLKAFYREVLGINPSTAVIMRRIIEEHMSRIDLVILEMNKGVPIEKISGMQFEVMKLKWAVRDNEDEASEMPTLPADPQPGKFPTFYRRVASAQRKRCIRCQAGLQEILSKPPTATSITHHTIRKEAHASCCQHNKHQQQ